MNAQIVPLTEEETLEIIREMAEMSPLMPRPPSRPMNRERRRELTKHIIKESK